MSVSTVSPVLVGRQADLGVLDAAFADVRAGTARTVLLGGEAGVGKTRLVREFGAGARDARLLVGGCLELGVDGFPFAPFTAILRQLVRESGADGVAALVGGRTAGLARLLPEFGEPDGEQTGQGQARLFELVLTLLDRLAAAGPVVLVVEDAHWADRSSRDLLAFLVRNLGAVAALLVVVTYRSDELHRTHPLRPLLAELVRIDRVSRLELGRLGRREVGELMTGLRGAEPEPAQVEQFYDRSEGNPLFVEALMEADGGIACELPESLRDLLLTGVQRLPEETQELLRVASAGGARVEHRLLAAVHGGGEDGLARGLRPAVAGNVLAVDGDGYAFRHALIREALHDDLLPGEHTRLHTRYAEALEDDPALVPPGRAAAELAHHWHAAHNLEWALVSAWRAALEAERSAAYAEKLRMLERVLDLWDRVPGAAAKISAGRGDVLEEAVSAADWAGASERGLKLASAALAEATDPLQRARLLERRGRMRHRAGRPGWMDDLRTAIRIVPDEPTVGRARVLAAFAQHVFMGEGSAEAAVAAKEALRVARIAGDPLAEASSLLTLACLEGSRAYRGADSPMLDQAERLAAASGLMQIQLRCAVNRSHFLEGAGRHAEAVEVARAAVAKAKEFGVYRTQGSFLAINYAESLYSLGRWDAALRAVDKALESDPPRPHRACLLQTAGDIRYARGDLAGALRMAEQSRRTGAWEIDRRLQEHFPCVRLEAEVHLAQGDPGRALELLAGVLAETGRPDDSRYTWPALIVAARAATSAEELAPFAARAAELPVFGPLQELLAATYAAEAARVTGAEPGWDAVITGWEKVGQPFTTARCLLAAAAHAASRGRRDDAVRLLDRADPVVAELGAALLAERSRELRRRAGGTGRAAHGLTARELEVLRHLSLGLSNREIAERLFISAKTASVHVSNILAKLGASSRTEAAATARRLGVPVD